MSGNILVATVEHSGTFALLRALGWKEDGTGLRTCPFAERARAKEGQILNAHLYPGDIDAILEYAATNPVITAIRPKADLIASWQSRGRNLAKLDVQLANQERLLALEPRVVELSREDGIRFIQKGKLWP